MSDLMVVAGATGLVGSFAISTALQRGWRVAALVRDPGKVPQRDGLEAIATNFDALADLSDRLKSAAPTAFLCALGTTIRTAGSQQAFARVDRDYVAAFAQLGVAAGAKKFGMVSSVGADAASSNFYLRTKGEAEAAVRAAGYAHVEIARPSFLTGPRAEKRIGEKIAVPVSTALAPLLIGPLAVYRPIAAATVARALVAGLEQSDDGVFVRHFPELRALANA